MFRIVCDTSSGSNELCLTEITRGGSQIFSMCQTPTKHTKNMSATTSNFSQAQLSTP